MLLLQNQTKHFYGYKKLSNLEEKLLETSEDLLKVINLLIPKPRGGESRVIEAMRYSSFTKGKRLRPFLVVSTAELFGVSRTSSMIAAAAVELVHTYSLVHDDLPAMDNDPVRRGQPSCHIMFDEATAILAGDGLLTLAFQVLTDDRVHADPKVRCELIRALSEAAGCKGMVGGQMMDLLSENAELSKDEVIRLQRMKTGELFAISCEFGAILGKAPERLNQALRNYAHNLGLAFQITDDILDAEGPSAGTTKSPKKQNREANKPNLVSILGVDRAQEQASMLCAQAKSQLEVFDKKAEVLRELADFVVTRRR